MEPTWGQIYADVEDLLGPQLSLDPWERVVYYHLLRHTRLKGLSSALFAIGPLSKAISISDFKARDVVRSLHEKGCLKIEDRSRNGHLITVLLPSEIPSLARAIDDKPTLDLSALDFFSGRRYVGAVLAREGNACFYCLRSITPETCELDHLVPQAEKVDNTFKNIVASCHNCNKAKGSSSAIDFLRTRYRSGMLSEDEFQNRLMTLEAVQSGALIPDVR